MPTSDSQITQIDVNVNRLRNVMPDLLVVRRVQNPTEMRKIRHTRGSVTMEKIVVPKDASGLLDQTSLVALSKEVVDVHMLLTIGPGIKKDRVAEPGYELLFYCAATAQPCESCGGGENIMVMIDASWLWAKV